MDLQSKLDEQWKRVIKQIHLSRETGTRYDMSVGRAKEIKAQDLYRDATQALNQLGKMPDEDRVPFAEGCLAKLTSI